MQVECEYRFVSEEMERSGLPRTTDELRWYQAAKQRAIAVREQAALEAIMLHPFDDVFDLVETHPLGADIAPIAPSTTRDIMSVLEPVADDIDVRSIITNNVIPAMIRQSLGRLELPASATRADCERHGLECGGKAPILLANLSLLFSSMWLDIDDPSVDPVKFKAHILVTKRVMRRLGRLPGERHDGVYTNASATGDVPVPHSNPRLSLYLFHSYITTICQEKLAERKKKTKQRRVNEVILFVRPTQKKS